MFGSIRIKAVAALVLGLFLAVNVGGLLASEIMMIDGDMGHHCPFMDIPALCTMNPLEHLSSWQQMFAATTQQLPLLLLGIFLAIALSLQLVTRLRPSLHVRQRIPRYREIDRSRDPLRRALSRGIMHSKAF